MPKMATKAADNVFYKARIAAASWNDRLGSREGASEVTGIDRTRLANIELGTINPHPEEVLMLSDTYNAPELQNHFCSHLCPLGITTSAFMTQNCRTAPASLYPLALYLLAASILRPKRAS